MEKRSEKDGGVHRGWGGGPVGNLPTVHASIRMRVWILRAHINPGWAWQPVCGPDAWEVEAGDPGNKLVS